MTVTDAIDISVVIGFKDWGLDRLRLAVETLHESFGALRGEVIVSDYGSTTCPEARGVVEGAGGRHVYTETDGIWSRSRALNAGIAASTGRVVVTTDADMVFSPHAMETIGRRLLADPTEALVLQCRDLPTGMDSAWIEQNGKDWQAFAESATLRPRWGMGGMMAVTREAYLAVRGFDERMQIYGGEDLDFAQRIRRAGHRVSWIEDPEVRMYHMWHPSSRTAASETPEGLAAIEYNRDILLKDPSVVRNTKRWQHRPPDALPLATVVIATRNRAALLRESICSALAQTVTDIEVLVVDDQSEDDTRAVVEGIEDPRVRYLQSPRRGIAAARNHAATQTRSRYTVVHDDDDLMMPDRVEQHFAALVAGDSGSYGGWVDFDDRTGDVVAVNHGKPYSLGALLFTDRVYAHATLMLETRLLREVGYDERFRSGSDYNLAVRLARLGISLRHTGHVHLVRRLHSGQVTHQDSSTQQSAGRWTTAAVLGLMPAELQASARAKARAVEPVDLGRADEAVGKSIRPFLPDSLVVRDVHVVLEAGVDPSSVPGLTEVVTVSDLLHRRRPDLVCGVLRRVAWADLAALGGVAQWSVLRARPASGRVPAEVPVEPGEHLRRLSLHALESLPTTRAALVTGRSELVKGDEGSLLGHWQVDDHVAYLVSMPTGQELVDALRSEGGHEIRMVKPSAASRPGVHHVVGGPVHRVAAPPPQPAGPAGPRRARGGRGVVPRHQDTQPETRISADPLVVAVREPDPVEERRRRLRRAVLVTAVSLTAVLGSVGVAVVVGGGVAGAIALAVGLWFAAATAAALVLLLRSLDATRRTEEAGMATSQALAATVEHHAEEAIRQAEVSRTEDRVHDDQRHQGLVADVARHVKEQQRAGGREVASEVTKAVLAGVSETSRASAGSISKLVGEVRDRVASLDARTAAQAGWGEDLRAAVTAAAGRQDDALASVARQVAESAREQQQQARSLAHDWEQQLRGAELRLAEVISDRVSKEQRQDSREALADLLERLTSSTRADTERVSGLIAGLGADVGRMNDPLRQIDGRLGELGPRLAGIDQRVAGAHDDVVAQVQRSVARVSSEVGEAVAGVDRRVSGVHEDLREQVASSAVEVQSSVARVSSEVGEAVAGVDRRVSGVHEDLREQVASSAAEVRTSLEGISSEIGDGVVRVDRRVSELEPSLSAIDGKVDGLRAPLDRMGTRIDDLEAPLGVVQRKVRGLEAPLSDLGQQVSALAGPLEVVSQRTEDIQRHQDSLEKATRGLPDTMERRTRLQLMHHLSQVQALENLFQMVPLRSAAPGLGGWAVSAEVLLRLVDELVSQEPSLVVECGSGSSTVWLALVVREFGLPTRIVALEHDQHFLDQTAQLLERHGLGKYAEVRLAPLAEVTELADHSTPWYDTAALADLDDIGVLFVDGPPGDTGELARLPAVPVLRERLAERCTVVLDDHQRPAEQTVAERWREVLPDFAFEELEGDRGAAVFTRGTAL